MNNTTSSGICKGSFNKNAIIEALKKAGRAHGLDIPSDLTPGKVKRFKDGTGSKANRDGWVVFFINPNGSAGGCFGNWKTVNEKWFYNPNGTSKMSQEDRQKLSEDMERAIAEQERQKLASQRKAAIECNDLWNQAEPASPEHPYFIKKQCKPHVARQIGDTIYIPYFDSGGALVSVQRIYPDGTKLNFTGGKTKDCFCVLGDAVQSTNIYIVEGFATGATIHEVTGDAVYVSYSTGNLKAVTAMAKERHTDKTIIIAADNDLTTEEKTGKNPGRLAAESTSKFCNVEMILCPIDSDFNDLFCQDGAEPLLEVLGKAINKTLDVWTFEDAEFYIVEKLEIDELTSSQKMMIARDLLENNVFDALEHDLILGMLKKYFGINKGALNQFSKSKDDAGPGSDERTHIELAVAFRDTHYPDKLKSVGCEGQIWQYSDVSGLFEAEPLRDVEMSAGLEFKDCRNCKKGGDYHHVAKYVYQQIYDGTFFSSAPYGLPGATKFFQVINNRIDVKDYDPTLRQRFKLPFDPDGSKPPKRFLIFLSDTFGEDQEQIILLQECIGALVTGIARKLQKVFFFFGLGENGKGVLMSIIEHFFDRQLVCAVKPDQLSNEYYIARIAGKVLNLVGELDNSHPIKAEFKDVVGCDVMVSGRVVKQEVFEFTPVCGHLFASNTFPQTRDHSHGFYRRWAMFNFRNKVKSQNKIPDLGNILLKEEGPQILAWALDGAKRLIANGFNLSSSTSHDELLTKWKRQQDSVTAFLSDDDSVQIKIESECEKKEAYNHYWKFCIDTGSKPLKLQNFYERILERFTEHKPPYGKRTFRGFRLI